MRLALEARVTLETRGHTVDSIIESLATHCVAVHRDGPDFILEFGSARAVVRPQPDAVWLRVESDEPLSSYGASLLLEAGIEQLAFDRRPVIIWIEAADDPFATVTGPRF